MRFLRQSTAIDILVGPLVDETDGVTPITTVTLAGVTAAVIKGDVRTGLTLVATGNNHFTHVADGYWELNLTTADANTTGIFRVTLRDDDGFLPVWEDFMVLPQQVFDSLVAGTDQLDVDAGVTGGLTAAAVADAVLDESVSEHQTAGTVGAELHLTRAMLANKRRHTVSTGVDEVFDDDGTTLLRTMTPIDGGSDQIEVDPS